MPAPLNQFSFSLKIRTPIDTVASKLSTDQIVPTMESWFFCSIAGSQAKVPSIYAVRIKATKLGVGCKANFFEKNSPHAKNKADRTNQIK